MKLTFLGTGTSFGVPQLGCGCAVCRSPDPRDRRTAQRTRRPCLVTVHRRARIGLVAQRAGDRKGEEHRQHEQPQHPGHGPLARHQRVGMTFLEPEAGEPIVQHDTGVTCHYTGTEWIEEALDKRDRVPLTVHCGSVS